MKHITIIMIFLSHLTFGQTFTVSDIDGYTKTLDKLKSENRLTIVANPNMSPCGGGVYGYYQDGELVVIDSKYQAELGFSSRVLYFKNNQILKIIYREFFAEWEKYEKKYPSDKFEWDPSKMTYTDTLYTIRFSHSIVFEKLANQKVISKKANQELINIIVTCGHEMKNELQEVISKIDSLKFITEMPYICENGICGDNLFWQTVQLGKTGIGLLIDKLVDTTSTTAIVPLFGYNYTVADIAFVALKEIIHDIPTFDLLGVPFDQEGCGYCSYWQHLNNDFANRLKFGEAVKKWYYTNESNLIWIRSNDFETCDCKGKHPNGGHYKVKQAVDED